MASFNLIDEPWIPCTGQAGGLPRLWSLRAVFTEAPQLYAIADASPSVTVSLYRLLLAILHRSLNGPGSVADWQAIAARGAWPLERINAYLDRWRDRFDLFDAEHPFYQTPLEVDRAPAATQLTHERASERNKSLLFDHTLAADAALAPAEAARYLVAMHNFAVGGTISLRSSEPTANKYAEAGPLLGAALTLVRGATLFETLMWNWVRYHRADGTPFPFRGDDQPAWEREGGARPEPRLPDGYVDLLTWQSRRILLIPREMAGGMVQVRQVALMKGYQFADGFEPWRAETMVAYRKSANATNGSPWHAIRLDEERMIWRDSQALLQSVAEQSERPRVVQWLDTLIERGAVPDSGLVPLDIYGLIPDQANIRDWRRESLRVPVRLLQQGQSATQQWLDRLKAAIDLAEDVASLFVVGWVRVGAHDRPMLSPMWTLCDALLAGLSDRTPKKRECEELGRRFGAAARYWARLDSPFHAFLVRLVDPSDVSTDAGATRYGLDALRAWAAAVEHAARRVWDGVVTDQDESARALRASARAQQWFDVRLSTLLAPFRPEPHEEENRG